MVIVRKSAFIKRVKDITIGSSLSLMLMGGTAMMQSCSRGKEEYVETYTKGVQTYVKEEEKGVFKIVDETVTDSSQTKAFVEYLDGRKDTLTPAQIKKLITTEVDTTGDWDETSQTASEPAHSEQRSESHYNPIHSGLGMLFWYSAMGHMFGRGTAFSNSRYYASPDVYNRSRQNTTQLQQSRVVRPTNSSRGFFKSFSRSMGS